MCELCMKHGAGGKWYLNAEHYSNEIVEKYRLKDFLMEQYRNFEQLPMRKVAGVDGTGLGYKLRMPLVGRLVKRLAENMLHSTRPPTNPFKAEGHIGQIVPLEDAIAILESCAAEPIIEKNCMCRMMSRGIKEACCINFGVMSEIAKELPRFVPEKDKFFLTRAQAVDRFKAHNTKGYIGTIWFGPFPYINNLCSCASPECAGIRPRLDYGVKSIYKAEYIIDFNPDKCSGCKACVAKCQFGAIEYSLSLKRVTVDMKKCWGCGVCRHGCKGKALYLQPREGVPAYKDDY